MREVIPAELNIVTAVHKVVPAHLEVEGVSRNIESVDPDVLRLIPTFSLPFTKSSRPIQSARCRVRHCH
jgi:hypothetical protein